MTRHLLTLSLGIGAMALATQHAFAAPNRNCAPRPVVLEKLATQFGETRQSVGLGGASQVVEVFASPETGSWTITVTAPNGVTCVVAAGRAFENLSESLPPQGNPA